MAREIDPRITRLIHDVFNLPDVDDVAKLSEAGGMKLDDGRWLVPLNVYLKRKDGDNTLGVHVAETVATRDKFGG